MTKQTRQLFRLQAFQALLIITTLLVTSGCGLSPQIIEIHPAPNVEPRNLGANHGVRVTVTDARQAPAFGSRGGIYRETSLIRPANSVANAIQEAVTKNLQTLGFNAYNPGPDATDVELVIQRIEYLPEQGVVITKVDIDTYIQAIAKKGDTTHKGDYRTKSTYEQPVTPSAKRNEAIINEAIDDTITRFLSDKTMLAFLKGEKTHPEETPAESTLQGDQEGTDTGTTP